MFKPSMHEQQITRILVDGLPGVYIRDTSSIAVLRRVLLTQSGTHVYANVCDGTPGREKKLARESAGLSAEMRK